MVVRAVHVHKPFANGGEAGEGGGGTVDKLAVGSRGGEGAFEDELMVVTGFEAVVVEETFERGAEFPDIEDGLDAAAFLAAADEGTVGAFTENEVEGAENDGFAGAGFAGDDIAAGLELEREVAHEGEVFDAQRRQHDRFVRPEFGGCAAVRQKKSSHGV